MTAGLMYEERNPCGQYGQDDYPLCLQKQKPRRRIKTTPLQILDHALPYLLLWQSPMHCAVRCIFTYALGTGVAHIFAKFSAVEQCVRHSKELHRLYDRGT